MSVGLTADLGFLAVGLEVTLVINLVVVCRHFYQVTFPAKEITPLAGIKLYCLVTEAHRCK